jgi:hypothetical protein
VQLSRRTGVSELYAAMLMIGITLVFGGFVTGAAISQFGLASYSASVGAAVQEASVGKLVSFVYGVASPSGSCPVHGGVNEGTAYTIALYNYGTANFTPIEVFFNGTLYTGGGYGIVPTASLTTFTLTLSSCAHSSGQTVLLVDAHGDEVQFET